MTQEGDSDFNQLMSKIQGLLSFQPEKPDKFASTNIGNPILPIKRKLDQGAFEPSCKMVLGNKNTPGLSYYHSYFNLNNVPRGKQILHLYAPHSLPKFISDLGDSVQVVLHSHESTQYCPWKMGCHILLPVGPNDGDANPVGYRIGDAPEWFQNLWRHIYD